MQEATWGQEAGALTDGQQLGHAAGRSRDWLRGGHDRAQQRPFVHRDKAGNPVTPPAVNHSCSPAGARQLAWLAAVRSEEIMWGAAAPRDWADAQADIIVENLAAAGRARGEDDAGAPQRGHVLEDHRLYLKVVYTSFRKFSQMVRPRGGGNDLAAPQPRVVVVSIKSRQIFLTQPFEINALMVGP